MSEIGYCKRGGMEGITFDYEEALELSDAVGSKYIDEYVPLPGLSLEKQIENINDKEHLQICGADEYYEREDGSHGWACSYCGKVHQWG